MTAFLKIDHCKGCRRDLPWEFVPSVLANGKPLAGTGVWRSQLVEGVCPPCLAESEAKRQQDLQTLTTRNALIQLLGGPRPYREFTFEKFAVTASNRFAYERAEQFNPAQDNLYLWGACGVGKTHLAWAAARRCFEGAVSVNILQAWRVSRRVRMKDPPDEQAAIDEIVDAEVLVLDDLSSGTDTLYSRQLFQEILDARVFQDRAGLLVTSKYSLDQLAAKLDDDSIPSRLAGLCTCIRIVDEDHRLRTNTVLFGTSSSKNTPPRGGS